MTKREIALSLCRIAGYHNDKKSFTRAYLENRLSMPMAQKAWAEGVNQKESGMKCTCRECQGVGAV